MPSSTKSSEAGSGSKRSRSPAPGPESPPKRVRLVPPPLTQTQRDVIYLASILTWIATLKWPKLHLLAWTIASRNSLRKRLTPEGVSTESLQDLLRGIEATKANIPEELTGFFEAVKANANALILSPGLTAAFAEELGSSNPELARNLVWQLSQIFRESVLKLLGHLMVQQVTFLEEKATFQQNALKDAQLKAFRFSRLPNFSEVSGLVRQFSEARPNITEMKRVALELDQLVSSSLAS